jgi:hypothetical protein
MVAQQMAITYLVRDRGRVRARVRVRDRDRDSLPR